MGFRRTEVRVFDVEPELLRKYAKAQIHSGDEAWIHMEAEFVGDIDGLMATLVPQEPLAYTILPQFLPDGNVRSPISSTFDEIRECYKIVRGRSALINVELVSEIRGAWYDFQAGVNTGRVHGQDEITNSMTIAIFPVSGEKGITGELVWMRLPRDALGAGPKRSEPVLAGDPARRQLLALHKQFLDGYRANDVEAILATMNDGIQANVRNYVNDDGGLIGIESKDDYRAYLTDFFEKFEVLKVDHLHRLTEDFYVFAEVRFEIRERATGKEIGIHTAEFFVPAHDDRFIIQIGHGTDLAA
jgi:hypothetical protein